MFYLIGRSYGEISIFSITYIHTHTRIHIYMTCNHKLLNISHIFVVIFTVIHRSLIHLCEALETRNKTINEDGRIFYKLTIVISRYRLFLYKFYQWKCGEYYPNLLQRKDKINKTYIFLYPELSYNLCTISYRLISIETVNAINQYTVQTVYTVLMIRN